MEEVRDAYLIECRRCGNRHWISAYAARISEAQIRKALRCSRCKGRDIVLGRISLPYDFPLDARLYEGFPDRGPHQILARCSANTYAYALFDWISAKYPHKRYVITDEGRVLKDTGDREPR